MQAEDGHLPAEEEQLCALSDLDLSGSNVCVLEAFPIDATGRRANVRALREWHKRRSVSDERRTAGAKGNDLRWQKDRKCDAVGIANGSPLLQHPQPHPQPEITSTPKGERRASKPALSPSFAAFWQAYPSKTGKGAAERAWARVSPDAELLATILQAVAAQKTWRQWVEGFVPNPATWINQRRWEDERPVERGQGAASHIQDVPAERRPAAYKPFELPPEPQDDAPMLSLRDVSETARRRLGGGA
jgi:hypothetical protein